MANRIPTLSSVLIFVLAIPSLSLIAQPGQATNNSSSEGTALPVQVSDAQSATDAFPNPPEVNCKNNQLAISTNNSTLGSVLSDVQKCIGVKIEMPDGASTSRVFDKLGPGPIREVLASLLSSTGYDFVIGSSQSDPGKIESVLLMARTTSAPNVGPPDTSMTPARRAYLLMQRDNSRTGAQRAEETGGADNTQADAPARDDAAAPADNGGAKADPTPPTEEPPAPVDMNPRPLLNQGSVPLNTNPAPTPSGNTQDGISNMEKLFEQRRQLNQTQKPQ